MLPLAGASFLSGAWSAMYWTMAEELAGVEQQGRDVALGGYFKEVAAAGGLFGGEVDEASKSVTNYDQTLLMQLSVLIL